MTLKNLVENRIGKEILKRLQGRRYAKCGPTMIPPIPDSNIIDMLPEGVLEGQTFEEKKQQNSYMAEVKLYRCLEELKKNYLVIHQLKNTHEQYSAFVGEHSCYKIDCEKGPNDHPCCKKKNDIEGECDIVVVGDSFVAIFEVKWFHSQNADEDERTFMGDCKIALMQRRRMKDLVTSIDPTVIVYEFTVFPDVSIDEIKECFLKDETIIFSDDLQYMTSILDSCEEFSYFLNVTKSSRDKLYRCLTGLWCIDQQNKWDFSSCELTKCIKDINQKLRQALVTRKAVDSGKPRIRGKGKAKVKKEYPENPVMVEAPDLFKDYLKISCLTKDQLDVYNCKERFLWVEGPAGSGKTIAMLGKIIDIVLNNDTESVLIMSVGWKTSPAVLRYHEVLNRISDNIDCSIVEYTMFIEELSDIEDEYKVTAAEISLFQQLDNLSISSRIVILALNFTLLPSTEVYDYITRFDHVFVDDYQSFHDHLAYEVSNSSYKSNCMLSDGLLPVVKKPSTNNTSLWVFSDIGQSTVIYNISSISTVKVRSKLNEFKEKFKFEKLLPVNLRNTHEISSVLSVIRKHYNPMDLSGAGTLGLRQQKNGHFLRGTKPTFYLLRNDNLAACEAFLEEELAKLTEADSCFNDKDIAVLYDGDRKYRDELLEMAEKLLRIRNKKIAVQYTEDCRSAEWTAVVYLHRLTTGKIPCTQSDNSVKEITFSNTIPFLNQALSRARVYSTVIIYNYTPNACTYTDNMLSELRERTDICRIVDVTDLGIDIDSDEDIDDIDSDEDWNLCFQNTMLLEDLDY